MADFYGKTLSEEQVEELAQHLNIDNFKKNKAVNMQDLKDAGVFRPDGAFIRKGTKQVFYRRMNYEYTRTYPRLRPRRLRKKYILIEKLNCAVQGPNIICK